MKPETAEWLAWKISTLRGHAWLERFREASYENRFAEMSPFAANQIAKYVDDFLNDMEQLLPSVEASND